MEIVDVYGLPSSAEAEPVALTSLRAEIDTLDQRLVHPLTARFRLVQAIGEVKERHGLLRLDPAREADIVKRATRAARKSGVPEEGLRDVIWAVLGYCRDGLEAPASPDGEKNGAGTSGS